MLRTARKEKGLSQKSLAERLGITQSYLSQLENRDKYNQSINIELIRKLSNELDLNPVDVFIHFYYE